MFSTVFQDEELCRGLVELVLDRRIESIVSVTAQSRLRVSLNSRAGIVDVIARDADGNAFDVEMQNEVLPSLARRVRYYGSLIDVEMLARGADFEDLRDRVVIFICASDPFEDGLKRYTFCTTCKENGRCIDDGQTSVYLNVKGQRGDSTPELDAFLAYVADDSRIESDYIRRLDDAVRDIRDDPIWKEQLVLWELKYQEQMYYAKKAAQAEGLEEGRAEGRAKGRAEGRAEGRTQQLDELSRLADALERQGRSSELPRALRDADFRERLMDEFGIGESAVHIR